MPVSKLVGTKVKRREDPRLVQGLSHYVDDLRMADVMHAAILRSPHAHARIIGINTDAARALPGVVTVVTGADIGDSVGSVPCAAANPTLRTPPHPVLAQDEVRYVGEPVAVAVAGDSYTARDARDLIEVDYEPLPAVSDLEKALQPGSPLVHSQWDSNQAFTFECGTGDMDKARAEADVVVKQKFIHQRLAPISVETRGVVARYFPGEDELTVWSSTQIPHLLRAMLALMLNYPEHRIRIIAPEVGGGFGCKLNVYREEGLLAHLAMKLKGTVKWIEGRRENMQATIHGRGQVGTVEAAVKKDGTILGVTYDSLLDTGAYHQLLTPGMPPLTGLMISGSYKIPTLKFTSTGGFTNKVATDAYRGAGRPEATLVIERTLDLIARELDMDPVELRRKNFAQPSDFPLQVATGLAYDSGNYQAALDRALEMVGYQDLRAEQKRLREEGRHLGIGFSTYVEICAMGPSAALPAGGWESGTVRMDFTGKATVLTGVSPHGQGEETTFAQIVSDDLGVPIEDVAVKHGDTAVVPNGIGTFGSRGISVGGTAVYMATQQVREKAEAIAANVLECSTDDLEFEDGKFTVKGVPDKGITIQEVALQAHVATKLPAGMEPGLQATSVFEPSNFTFPFGTHICVVEVDTQSGEIEIKKYVAVDDCGKVINPMIVDGQVQGGIAQGLGQALLEEVIYDEDGQLVTGSLMDYAVARAEDLPPLEFDRTETPSPVNPMGVKGVGEAGTIGSTPSIVNAVVDALAPFGVKHIDMPLKPEKIWRLCQGGNK
ncbi:MAG: xanthine dehydrogenase family protein molybdopterin-binding subunit [Deltaproteobacteria bacterium]|nr:xanthine dehydrogenase family protein molybdopterin-binding subunit [Deltaproteobacteria bacterium]